MSARTYAADSLTRHQVYLQRYSSGEVKKMLPYLNQMRKDILAQINSYGITDFQYTRLATMQRDVELITKAAMESLNSQLMIDLTDLGEYEGEFTTKLMNNMTSVTASGVSVDQIAASISDTPMILISGKKKVSLTINQAVKQFGDTASRDVGRILQTGISTGRTTNDMSNEISRLLNTRTKAQAEALIRTSANHAGTMARNKVYEENSDIIEKEEFLATLDGRTSLTCAGYDGKYFEQGQGPMPALHFNCRSIRLPVVKDEFTIDGLKGERASMDGPVSANRTYGGWLKDQPVSFQNDALGEDRAKLFRNGGLSIDKFTDNSGITYSLDELRALEPQAFARVNI